MSDDMGVIYKNYERARRTFEALNRDFAGVIGRRSPSSISKELIAGFREYSKLVSKLLDGVDEIADEGFKDRCMSSGIGLAEEPYYDINKVDVGQSEIEIRIRGLSRYLPIASDNIGNRKAFEELYYNSLRSYAGLSKGIGSLYRIRLYLRAACMFKALIRDFDMFIKKSNVLDVRVVDLRYFLHEYLYYNLYYNKYTDEFMKDMWVDEEKELKEGTDIYEDKLKQEQAAAKHRSRLPSNSGQ